MMMETGTTDIPLIIVLCAFVLCSGLYGVFRQRCHQCTIGTNTRSFLQIPLLVGEERHRIDAAIKQAQEGFTKCSMCAFENFKQTSFCLLCGAKLGPYNNKMTFSKDIELMPRQKRAIKRKQWVRKLDVEGRMYWYRDHEENEQVIQPGYVVALHPLSIHKKQSTNGSFGSFIDDINEYASDPNENKKNQDQQLKKQHKKHQQPQEQPIDVKRKESLSLSSFYMALQSIHCEKIDASHADASVFPSEKMSLSKKEMKEFIELTKSDFPTKYAYFVTKTSALFVPSKVNCLSLNLDRTNILNQTLFFLSNLPLSQVRTSLCIIFQGENGLDIGGLQREWFMLVTENLLDETTGLFKCMNQVDQSYYFNPNSAQKYGEKHLVALLGAGRFVGHALLEGQVLGFNFCVPLLKLILGCPVTFNDLEYLDEELYRNLNWLKENEDVETLGLDFTVDHPNQNQIEKEIELIPNGSEIPVTNENKQQYLDVKFKYIIFDSVSEQLHAFLKGIYQVVPVELLALFDYEELDYVLCGSREVDVDDWECNTVVSSKLKPSRTLRWFWEIVREMPNEYRSRLLQYATGSSRVPLVGFKGLTSRDGRLCPFSLKGTTDGSVSYIHAHACFNRLDLPFYTKKVDLEKALMAIVQSEDTYGFTEV